MSVSQSAEKLENVVKRVEKAMEGCKKQGNKSDVRCGSVKVAAAVLQGISFGSGMGVLIDDCCVLLSQFQSSSAAQVPRLCNRVANRLALFAFHLLQDCFWFGEALELVQDLLTQDCCLN
ncbi:hypothetical protein GBA52_016525 [Prunus armeniaca]|nr:hypothetical protein GBA52_016525 [Prunus armeniaca]